MSDELERVDYTKSQRMLIKHAHLSPVEIEQKTGIPAIEAAQALAELLSNRSWLSMRQEERLLLIEMNDLVVELKERLANVADDEAYAKLAKVVVDALGGIGDRLDAQRKNVDVDIAEIERAQAHVFGRAYDSALKYIEEKLVDEHPDVTPGEIHGLRYEAMQRAKSELEEHVAGG